MVAEAIGHSIEILLKRLINAMYHLPCFSLLVVLVAAAKIHFEDHALVADTSMQVHYSGRQTRWSGLPTLFLACYQCLLLQVN
jgi:ABC-type dipeptide/oligopeptide/nickel transport system permease subunit